MLPETVLPETVLPTSSSPTQLEEVQRELAFYRTQAFRLDRAVSDLRCLLQSGKGFSELMKIPDLLDAFMSVCRENYGIKSAAVLLKDDLDPDLETYRVRGYQNLPDFYTDQQGETEELMMFGFPRDRGLLWQLVQQGDVFNAKTMQGTPRFHTAWSKWNLTVLKSNIWVPLIKGRDVVGILTLGETDKGSRIPESEFGFLTEIASVAATNILSTLQYEKVQQVLGNMKVLYNINQQLEKVNDFKKLMHETLQTACAAMSAQKANLMLWNSETKQLEIKVVCGDIPKKVRDEINSGRRQTRPFQLGEGVAGEAAEKKKPLRINHRSKIKQFGSQVAHCILSVPLIDGDKVMVGVMNMTNKVKRVDPDDPESKLVLDELGRFNKEDEDMGWLLAGQSAVHLKKARHYTDSITDRMTNLKNKRHYGNRLTQLIQQADLSNQPFCLAVSDIDHFKRFNDTFGHAAGDHVLIETARLLDLACRLGTDDEAFRYGGEEFVMLLPNTRIAEAAESMERYRQAIEAAEFDYDGQPMKVTVSLGLCEYPSGGHSEKTVFERADAALYVSKQSGRNQVSLHQEGGAVRFAAQETQKLQVA
jgi:diguanylate cyclase (GGDEF)-like protein